MTPVDRSSPRSQGPVNGTGVQKFATVTKRGLIDAPCADRRLPDPAKVHVLLGRDRRHDAEEELMAPGINLRLILRLPATVADGARAEIAQLP